jgi:curved DNA-binding protein
MEYKDYYKVLGVSRDASQQDIKRAYRKLARKYHPDVSKEPDAETRFKEVGEAYEVLRDPEKRAAYDQLGSQYQSGQDFRPPPGWDANFDFGGGDFTGADASAFSDFFESLFGGGRSRSYRQGFGGGFSARGQDHYAKVRIDVEDAFEGGTRRLTLSLPEQGPGGAGTARERTLSVRIPKGIREGQQIRLKGQGMPGMGQGERGDLFLEVEFNPHPFYTVRGRDIYLDLPVAPWEAALGATVKAPTPAGPVELKVPAGSAQGSRLRLKGRGIPASPPGDLYAVLKIVLPPAKDENSRALYRKMAEEMAFNPREKLGV